MYFAETDILVFCFDIQEKEKKEEALEFFNSILKKLNELETKCPILVVFTNMTLTFNLTTNPISSDWKLWTKSNQ